MDNTSRKLDCRSRSEQRLSLHRASAPCEPRTVNACSGSGIFGRQQRGAESYGLGACLGDGSEPRLAASPRWR
jgi:hypothetical protein